MGVVSVHQYPIGEGQSGQQAVDGLLRTLELLGAKKVGTFLVDCETYYSAPNINPPRVMNIIHNSEQPATCYALLDTGSAITVDTNFDLLMLTMSSLYQTKKSSKMECKGPKLQLTDFIVKIGTVTIGPSFKGILIEVEYSPCQVANYCWSMMREFFGTFCSFPFEPHPFIRNKMNETFTPLDTIQQYNEQFNQLRKISSGQSAVGPGSNSSVISSNGSMSNSPALSNSSAHGSNIIAQK